MIKYLGSKKRLLESIVANVASFQGASSVIDLFSGTSRVGHALKENGYQVFSNDHNSYAHTLATCYVQSDVQDWYETAEKVLNELNRLPGSPGYFTKTFCEDARFFQPKNGERVDAIREAIEGSDYEPELKAITLVALMEAADRVDSTTGVQMAYLKSWADRSTKDLELRMPKILPRSKFGKSRAYLMEAQEAAKTLTADIAYVDPPYNQHSYLANYHIWESLVKWDKPEVYGIAKKRVDVRERKSSFNSRSEFTAAMKSVLESLKVKSIIVSFSDEGYITRPEMENLLSTLYSGNAEVITISHDYKRYVGAQIGIHNQSGEKVGRVSHLRNKEFLYVVKGPDSRWQSS